MAWPENWPFLLMFRLQTGRGKFLSFLCPLPVFVTSGLIWDTGSLDDLHLDALWLPTPTLLCPGAFPDNSACHIGSSAHPTPHSEVSFSLLSLSQLLEFKVFFKEKLSVPQRLCPHWEAVTEMRIRFLAHFYWGLNSGSQENVFGLDQQIVSHLYSLNDFQVL